MPTEAYAHGGLCPMPMSTSFFARKAIRVLPTTVWLTPIRVQSQRDVTDMTTTRVTNDVPPLSRLVRVFRCPVARGSLRLSATLT